MPDSEEGIIQLYTINTTSSGEFKVFVQGDFDRRSALTVFLTCHDLAANHNSFFEFVNQASMEEVRKISVFLHVCLPGQDENAPNLPPNFLFPSLKTIGHDLINVLDQLSVKYVVGMGDGVGANIMARFASAHPDRCYGLVLIRLNPLSPGVLQSLNYQRLQWTMTTHMSDGAWSFIVEHKFGKHIENSDEIIAHLKSRFNSYNVSRYVISYFHRSEVSTFLTHNTKLDILFIIAEKSIMAEAEMGLYHSMNASRTTILIMDDVANVLVEEPAKLARSLILFCKGISLLTSINVPGSQRIISASKISLGEH